MPDQQAVEAWVRRNEAATRMFAPDELIAALSDGGVEYVLIRGPAVSAHGFPRATRDLDIAPAPDETNLQRLAGVLRAIDARHFETGDFDPAEFPFDPLDPGDLREGGNFVLATRLGRLDIMQCVPGVPGDYAPSSRALSTARAVRSVRSTRSPITAPAAAGSAGSSATGQNQR